MNAPLSLEQAFQTAQQAINAGHKDKAVMLLNAILKQKPDHIPSLKYMAHLLEEQKPELCVQLCDQGLKITPTDADFMVMKARAFNFLGNADGAEKLFNQVLKIQPKRISAYFQLARLKKWKEGGEDLLKKMQDLEANHKLKDEEYMILCFGIGKILDDKKQFDAAFPYFRKANEMHKTIHKPIDHVAQNQNMVKECKETFTKAFFKERLEKGGYGDDAAAPVFIVGMPRSGSTLTEQILASHSNVVGIGESKLLYSILHQFMPQIDQEKYPTFKEAVEVISSEQSKELADTYLSIINKQFDVNDYRYVVNKQLTHYQTLGFIALMFPNAKIINCMRNPYDTILSIYSINFNKIDYAYDLGVLGEVFKCYNELMAHWHSVFDDEFGVQILDVHYEDLVEDTEGQTKRLLAFLDLEWEDACAEFFKTKRQVNTASVAQVRQPIYKSAMQRWKGYEKHLDELFEVLPQKDWA